MNYKNTAIAEIEAIAAEFPKYTLGQILLAITNRKPEDKPLRDWLYSISDEDLYTEIEKTKIIETEE
tara:strand:- start:1677 stop:1877 length:201 start_codon:yes stop_codon:yes gene_type:complete